MKAGVFFIRIDMPLDNPNEQFYLVDENDQIIGSIMRNDAHQDPHKIHRAVYILITNTSNQMLFQKRGLKKDLYPGLWALSCAGHVSYGQTYLQSAEREVFEELGIHPHLFYVTNLLVKTPLESEHCQVYLCKIEITPEHFDRTEIDAVQWVEINDITHFVSINSLPPSDIEVLKLLLYLK
jgi:isopentenyl-diphosphate delta-isomerase type 1